MTVVAIGNFDGVHLGHQAVVDCASELAKHSKAPSAALTFDPHPSVALGRGKPPMLTTNERRARLLAGHVDRVHVEPFTMAFSEWSPEQFVHELLIERLGATGVVVGHDFRFGKGRAGDGAMLRALGEGTFTCTIVSQQQAGGAAVSSSRVRQHVVAGELALAESLLGRPHALTGVVLHGAERGRTIGFPTANLGTPPEVLPPFGVYAAWVSEVLADRTTKHVAGAVLNLGVRPTVGLDPLPTLEVHLLDFSADLYDRELVVHLVAYLREERRFPGLSELKAQLEIDASAGRGALRGVVPPAPEGVRLRS